MMTQNNKCFYCLEIPSVAICAELLGETVDLHGQRFGIGGRSFALTHATALEGTTLGGTTLWAQHLGKPFKKMLLVYSREFLKQ